MSKIGQISGVLCIVLCTNFGFSQNRNYLLNFEMQNRHDAATLKSEASIHSSLRPLNMHFTKDVIDPAYQDSTKVYSTFHLKFLKEHLFQIKGKDYSIYIDPLFKLELGLDLLDTSGRGTIRDEGGTFYVNTRGFQAQGDLGKSFSFHTSFYENQAFFPDYLRLSNNDRAELTWTGSTYKGGQSVVPGEGRAKEFKGSGFDYAYATGYVSYSPTQHVNLQFGHGKHFVGNGYRSLLLSDNAFNYPYWSVQAQFLQNKIKHNFIYAYMQNLFRIPEHSAPEATYIRKNGSFNYTSFKPKKEIEIGLFEGIIWNVYDQNTGTQYAPINSHLPIPFVNTIIYGLNDTLHNAVLGLTAKVDIGNKIMVYGQLMADDLSNSKWGFQIGAKAMNLVEGLTVSTEINTASAYSYAHENVWHNYSHYNQSIAHPYGAGFFEWVSYARYQLPNRFWVSYKFNMANMKGDWNNLNNGSNIFLPYDEQLSSNSDVANLQFHQAKVGYRANIKTNMEIYAGFNLRHLNSDDTHNSLYTFVGISTNLNNKYYDF